MRNTGDDLATIRPIVRWLVESRQRGRWGNTQENAWALEALVDYYRKYESVSPDFLATASLGSATLARRQFAGRSTMQQLRFGTDIKNIAGATLSSEHVTAGVRRILAIRQTALVAAVAASSTG